MNVDESAGAGGGPTLSARGAAPDTWTVATEMGRVLQPRTVAICSVCEPLWFLRDLTEVTNKHQGILRQRLNDEFRVWSAITEAAVTNIRVWARVGQFCNRTRVSCGVQTAFTCASLCNCTTQISGWYRLVADCGQQHQLISGSRSIVPQ